MPRKILTVGFGTQLEDRAFEIPPGEASPWDARAKLEHVGKPAPRREAGAKVAGQAKYTFDVRLPGMLHAAVLRCPLPCAKVKSISIDAAVEQPGVRAVLALVAPGDPLIFAGQDVAAVAALRPELARDALAHIKVEYEPLPFVVHTQLAASPRAPRVHLEAVQARRTEGDEPGRAGEATTEGNVRALPRARRGDVARALAAAQTVHRGSYHTQVQTHSALETHGIVVRWDRPNKLTAWCSTQGIFSVRDELAEVFELAPGNVEVRTDFMGGGFGAKFGASAPGSRLGFIAGELARKAGQPVSLMCDRHEEQVCTGNRPDAHQDVTLAADAGGRLSAIQIHSLGTAGVGTGAGIGRNAFSIYTRCPNVDIAAHDVFTHAGPGTAMRAPGHPQGAFAIELALDELCAKLGADPVQFRLDHDEHPVRRWQLQQGAERFGWAEARARSAQGRQRKATIRTGVGVALSIWGDFGRAGAAQVTCSVGRDGVVEIRNGVQDIGGGITTVMAQVAAEVLRRPLSDVVVKIGNSEFGPSVGSGGSTTTSSVTPAVRNAVEKAKAELLQLAAELLEVPMSGLTWGPSGEVSGAGRTLGFTELCKKIPGEAVVTVATRPRTYGHHPMAFMGENMAQIAGVQFAQVEVDTWTGLVRCNKVLAIHDCGRIMNPLTARSQVNGGVILGTSYALLEERVMDPTSGRMLNPNLESYKILGARDVPDIDVVFTDVFSGANNTGAMGLGEPATIPTAAAIACAVFDALGVPVRSLPITPSKILAALGQVPT